MKTTFYILVLLSITVSSCIRKKEDPSNPVNPNENELITTFKLIVTNETTSEMKTFVFQDLDGEGGNNPTSFDSIRLSTNQSYSCEILLLDESKIPMDTISNEVKKEADEHQFFYSSSGINGLVVSYSSEDVDLHGVPLGLYPNISTGATSGTGNITFVLKHQGDDKPDAGNGNENLGATDIELTFPVKVQN